jgi:hypothetical protein
MDRRDFLNSTLLASGSALLGGVTPLSLLAEPDWTGFSGIGDYARSNGNTYDVMTAGHAIRDRVFESKPPEIWDATATLTIDAISAAGTPCPDTSATRMPKRSSSTTRKS